MSDTSEVRKKGGRPKSQPDDLPIIIAESRSRVQELVTMPAYHFKLLRQYAKWASKKAGGLNVVLTEDEAMSLVLSQGIDTIVQRDKAWAKDKRSLGGDDEEVTAPASAVSKPSGASEPAGRPPLPPTSASPGRNGSPPAPPSRET